MRKHPLGRWLLTACLCLVPVAHAVNTDPFGTRQALGLNGAATPADSAASGQKPRSESAPAPAPLRAYVNPALQASDVFGANLFTGSFARQGAVQFNSDYLIATGDRVQVRLWGGFGFDNELVVDPQGNIFLPNVGPVKVMGVANRDLQRVVETAVRRVYRANVFTYASLAAAQPVRIFVGGNVARPGLYDGTSMDSLLHYLDQAGGIDPDRGSFLAVEVKRGEQVRATVNLYDFLLEGRIPLLQLSDGDMIFVPARGNTVLVNGLAQHPKRFEFTAAQLTVGDIMRLARPKAQATHVRVTRSTGTVRSVEYYPLAESANVVVGNGDEVAFAADKKSGTIAVRVEGEHDSAQEYVLPYGARLGDLMKQIVMNDRSEPESVQLFRDSVKERQKEMLATSLRNLEVALLTARSGSSDEARLRKDEAELTLQWIDRAKQVAPLGQVVISHASARDDLLLENGDIIRIPKKDGLVLVSGEVLFPNAVAWGKQLDLQDYIDRAGGFTQNADNARIVVARRDGSFEQSDADSMSQRDVKPGDQVLVLPKVDEKRRQFWKDMTQIIYQIAVSAKVVFGL
jgi:protein involved in polysaccharide export with SLBB domain